MPLLVVAGYGPGISHATAARFGREGYSVALIGRALENAAKSKLVGVLAERLRPDGVSVGEVTINGSVGGTPTASPTAVEPSEVADLPWSMSRSRDTSRTTMSEDAPWARA